MVYGRMISLSPVKEEEYLVSIAKSAAFLVCAATLWATPITIYNTGLDNLGALLPQGSIDPHYALLISGDPAFPGPSAIVSSIPPVYVPNSSTSQWISPGPDNMQLDHFGVGSYTYQTTFDLTGLDASTAVLSGLFAADDIASIILNGQDTGVTTGPGGWTAFHLFSAASGFVDGVNTLEFVVNNDGGGPSGLRVEVSGEARELATDVPEPYTWPLVFSALAAIGYIRKRK